MPPADLPTLQSAGQLIVAALIMLIAIAVYDRHQDKKKRKRGRGPWGGA